MDEWRCKRCGQTFEEGPCPAAEREREAQEAVIEAAKALYQAERMPGVETYFAVHAAKQVFNKAVEALQEAER